jgi:hypothetical protein
VASVNAHYDAPLLKAIATLHSPQHLEWRTLD